MQSQSSRFRPLRPLRPLRSILLGAVAFLIAAGSAWAQQPVRVLADLEGARAAGAESVMKQRGYEHVGGTKQGGSAYTFWRENATNRCVSVRTADGRYQDIVYTRDADCQGQAGGGGHAAGDGFETVCGVETGGQTYRYRCTLRTEGCQGEGYCRSILKFPDLRMVLNWKSDDRVEVQMQGVAPQTTKTSFVDGQTRWELDGKTYFVYRTEERAKRELQTLD